MPNAIQMAYEAFSGAANLINNQQVNSSESTARTAAMERDINERSRDTINRATKDVADAADKLKRAADAKQDTTGLDADLQKQQTILQAFQADAQRNQQTARAGTEAMSNQTAQFSSFLAPVMKGLEVINEMNNQVTRAMTTPM